MYQPQAHSCNFTPLNSFINSLIFYNNSHPLHLFLRSPSAATCSSIFLSFFSTKRNTEMAHKSKVLIIGGTGYIGKFIVEASAKAGHPTFALVRESTVSDPVKGKVVENFKNLGVTLVHVRILISLCLYVFL